MTEIIFDKRGIYTKTSKLIKESIYKILSEKEKVLLGLPGGRSVPFIFESLKNEPIRWEKVHIFMVDERLVSIDDNESNFKLVRKGLSNVIPNENLHPLLYNETKQNYGLSDYEQEIKKFGGTYDIALVSSGEDGHIGALYPTHSSITDESDFLISMEDSPKPPEKRMSISKNFLLKSKVGIVLFIGEAKRQAYINFLDENLDYKKCPAKLISMLPESYVLTNIRLEEE